MILNKFIKHPNRTQKVSRDTLQNHDMDTLIIQVDCHATPQLGITVISPLSSSRQKFHSSNKHSLGGEGGLQIAEIQPGSVIARNGQFRIGDIIVEANGVNLQRRSFPEAELVLRDIMIKQAAITPLMLKVMRNSSISSSSPSMTSTSGSQATFLDSNRALKQDARVQNVPNGIATKTNMTLQHNSPKKASTTPSSSQNKTPRHLIGVLNTRKIGNKHRITLTKGKEGGFGIKIAERDHMVSPNRPKYITAITSNGSAYKDGRLKEGDMLLELNGLDITNRSQPEVTKMLKSVQIGDSVEFVVSRQEDDSMDRVTDDPLRDYVNTDSFVNDDLKLKEQEQSLIDLDFSTAPEVVATQTKTTQPIEKKLESLLTSPMANIDGPGNYVYDVPLNDSKSAGLGLYLKYPTLNGRDLGVWIENVITGGAAWKDGRLQPNDQILAINGINLTGLSNADASETLTAAVSRGGPEATSHTVRLNILRRDSADVARILHGTNNKFVHSDTPPDSVSRSISSRNNEDNSDRFTLKQVDDDDGSANAKNLERLIADQTTNFHINNDINSDINTQSKFIDNLEFSQNAKPPSATQSCDEESLIGATTGEEAFQRNGFGRQSISEKRHAQLMAQNTDTFKRSQRGREANKRQQNDHEHANATPIEFMTNNNSIAAAQPLPFVNSNGYTIDIPNVMPEPNGVYVARNEHDNQAMYAHEVTHPTYNANSTHIMNDTYRREMPVDVQIASSVDVRVNGSAHVPYTPLSHLHPAQPMQAINYGLSVPYLPKPEAYDCSVYVPNNSFSHTGNLNNYMQRFQQPVYPAAGYHHMHHYNNPCNGCPCNNHLPQMLSTSQFQRPNYPNLPSTTDYSYYNPVLKRSDSPEDIQNQQHKFYMREGLVVPRAGTVRVARNRKLNDSFRAAVDRSYEGATNYQRYNYTDDNLINHPTNVNRNNVASNTNIETSVQRPQQSSRISDERGEHSKKNPSLISKFLKLNIMKKPKKRDSVSRSHNSR